MNTKIKCGLNICLLLFCSILTHATITENIKTTIPEGPKIAAEEKILQPTEIAGHNITKRFVLLPVVLPKQRYHFWFGIRRQYTNPTLYRRYKRYLPLPSSVQTSSHHSINGNLLWDNSSAILALLQSLKQAIANIYQSSDLRVFLEWNRKAIGLLTRINALGIRFLPVQNSTVLFNFGALVPHQKYLSRRVNVDRVVPPTVGGATMEQQRDEAVGAKEIDTVLSNDVLGDLKINDRRMKRSIGSVGPGIFARAQANFRRIFPRFKGISSHLVDTQHQRYAAPKWEFPPLRSEDIETTRKNPSEGSGSETEEFNFLPHFEHAQLFDDGIDLVNNKLVDYLQMFTKEEPLPSNANDGGSAFGNNKIHVQVIYSTPEDVNFNTGDFKALPNYQPEQKFDHLIDANLVEAPSRGYEEETKPFLAVDDKPSTPKEANSQLRNWFKLVEPNEELVFRQHDLNPQPAVNVVTETGYSFSKEDVPLRSEIIYNDDKEKIGRRLVYKRVKMEDAEKNG